MPRIYDYFWLLSYDEVTLKYIFGKEDTEGWTGWLVSERVPHLDMIEQEPITWLKGLWMRISYEKAQTFLKKEEDMQRRDTSYRSVR